MKKFAIKFYAVLLVALAVIGYYAFCVSPKVSGDLGLLDLVPYGKEYTLNVNGMVDEANDSLCVTLLHDIKEISEFPIVTIGDSFSNLDYCSYPHFLGRDYGLKVGNVERNAFYQPVQDYLSLLLYGAFEPGQTVIVEIVEHYWVWRCAWLDFESQDYAELGPIAHSEWKKDILSEAARWVRLGLGYNNPVLKYNLCADCFSHPTRSRELHVYREEMSFQEIGQDQIDLAVANLERLFKLSQEKGVNMYFLVCADKYDSYEPWIEGEHPENPILASLPENDHIISMTPYVRELIGSGVKDVYQINDGHASTVGAALTAKVIYETCLSDTCAR